MAIKAYGGIYGINVVAESARIRRKRNGLQEGECTFECVGEQAAAGAYLAAGLPLGSSHPYNWSIFMETQEIIYTAKGALAVCSYAGTTFEFLEKPSYSLVIGMQEAPIETHPDFGDIAGTPDSPINGAIFLDPVSGLVSTENGIGIFDRFPPFLDDGSKNAKGGIEAFLDPVVTYRESYVSFTLPTVSGFGNVVSDVPGPGFRGSLGSRNWLYVGFTYERRGATDEDASARRVYEIQKEWKLSGRAGWDTAIYNS